jgi:Helicase associated domain
LDGLGFVWDSRASNWDNRFEDLRAFKEKHGHVKVSIKDRNFRTLAVWLKRQRQNARKLQAGDRSTGMTLDQFRQLLSLGVNLNIHLSKMM